MAAEITIVLVAFLLIGLLIASCGESQKEEIQKEKEKAQNSAQVNPVPACCCQNHDHHQSHHSGTAPLAPAYLLLPTVTSPSTTTTTAKSMGIRLEAAPPVTVIDMPSSILPVNQEFSKHPRPNVSMTIPDSER
ncbi:hypothetical protein BGZ90_011354 [Linnemannia elongata]|nr:hypothetical protein BGZ90_011354 [Linnemannia elongata]